MLEKIFREIQAELDTKADEEYRILVRDHFKMDVSSFLGVRIPLVRKIANKYFKELKGLRIEDILILCNQLLETKIYEHKVIAFHWSFKCGNQYQNEHFKVFESWLKTYVDDWMLTGDVGHVDDDGYLFITGRMKDIIITAGGKNITPAEIENRLKFSQSQRQLQSKSHKLLPPARWTGNTFPGSP